MQTRECPYCKQNIAEKAYDLHLKLCPKKPTGGEPATKLEPPKAEPPRAETKIPDVGTPEYKEYWRGLTTRGQQHELERRKALGVKPAEDTGEAVQSAVEQTSVQAPASPASAPGSENGAMEIFYPKADQYFIAPENIVEALRVTEALSHKHPTNLLVTGQPGGGKTCLALEFAAKFNRPAVVVDFGVLQEPQQLFQTTRLIQGDGSAMVTDIRETGFVRGMETEGCVVIMDEINRPENERVLNVLMPLLDGRRNCWIEDLRRRVNVADNVIFIATLNEGALFCGITSIDMALRDRFREIFLDYLPAEPESKVLEIKAGIPKVIANSLAEFAYTVRTTPTISKKISTRQLLHAAEAYAENTSLWQAVETAIGNYNDLEWRQRVMEIFSLSIKDELEYKKWTTKKVSDRYVKY
uniref:Putative ATPase domain containing protein n=1 Tax=viral metagenome TaxID=1070528 RepID=A0A6M3MCF4_9ZZZZ